MSNEIVDDPSGRFVVIDEVSEWTPEQTEALRRISIPDGVVFLSSEPGPCTWFSECGEFRRLEG